MFKNIHVQPKPEPAAPGALPKLRFKTNDPAREYQLRAGQVEKLPDSVAALILNKQGFSKVGRNGIKIELEGKALNYWSEHSITIQTKAGTNEKVLWTVNRYQPDVLHILSPDGEYIETVPLDGKVPWFDAEATARDLGAKRRVQARSMDRIKLIHAPDTKKELDRVDHNNGQIAGVVQTFPAAPISPHDRKSDNSGKRINGHGVSAAPEAMRENLETSGSISLAGTRAEDSGSSDPAGGLVRPSATSARDSFSGANRIHQVQRNIDGQRNRFEDRESTRKKAAAFGAATRFSDNLTSQPTADASTTIEEW